MTLAFDGVLPAPVAMTHPPFSSPLSVPDVPLPRRGWYHWRRWGFNFLTISILAHLLFGTGATYLVVQSIQAKRKQTFSGPPSSPNAPTHAMEHKVQMQKRQQTMSAPAPVKRITTTGNAKVALPAMPAMPKTDAALLPTAMTGMGGTGVGLGMGAGGSGAGSGSGGGLSLFGFRDKKNGAFTGTFFDLKQTPEGKPTPIAENNDKGKLSPAAASAYTAAVGAFAANGMDDAAFALKYYKGPVPLYMTQVFIPMMRASEGPKAFNVADHVQPSRWIVHYKGTVAVPESGTFHFVGFCDDVLVVRFNGSVVLDAGITSPTGRSPVRYYKFEGMSDYKGAAWFKGCGEGPSFEVEAGRSYPMDIIIGEWPGGDFRASLQLRKEGVEYKKDARGNPVLPLFRTAAGDVPGGDEPVYAPDGPIWRAVAAPSLGGLP